MGISTTSLKSYTQALLEANDCAVEDDGERLHVVLSSAAAERVKDSESSITNEGETPYRIFCFTRAEDEREGIFVAYGGEALKSLTQLMEGKGLAAAYAYEDAYVKKANIDEQMYRTFQWQKIKPVWEGAHERLHSYVVIYYKYKAVSDDRREGVVSAVVSEQTGAVIEEFKEHIEPLLSKAIPASRKHENICVSRLPAAEVFHHAYTGVKGMVYRELHEFISSMERRRARDSARIDEYYTTLTRQIEDYIARRALEADTLKKQQQKLHAVERDRAHKQRDITEKYTVDIALTPFAAIRIFVPVLVNPVVLFHGKERCAITLVWNSITRQFDPLSCKQCKGAMYTIGTCENWHLVCSACAQSVCRMCGKKQCLVCASVCKRCGK